MPADGNWKRSDAFSKASGFSYIVDSSTVIYGNLTSLGDIDSCNILSRSSMGKSPKRINVLAGDAIFDSFDPRCADGWILIRLHETNGSEETANLYRYLR